MFGSMQQIKLAGCQVLVLGAQKYSLSYHS